MCGICGIVMTREGKIPDRGLVLDMMDRLKHRGPDGAGLYRDSMACIGHTRLSIIDLSTGGQPLSNEDGTIWITFNGEIFNYIELRNELEAAGHRFNTSSDTETIVHAYEEWGTECFSRMNGQWAVALWDTRRKELILSRDRVGIRPLYYTETGGALLFASEIKSLFADPSVRRQWDPEGLSEILTFWAPVAPKTAFSGINELEPGSCITMRNGKIRKTQYWSPAYALHGDLDSRDIDQTAGELKTHLMDATNIRFTRSDVPVGAYLSGGLDSSVTCSLIHQASAVPFDTFSVRFETSEFDEGSYQQRMAERLGTKHHSVTVKTSDIGAAFPKMVYHAERPVTRTAPVPLYILSNLVRQNGYKVVVTGEGSDEMLGGYDIFREGITRRFVGRGNGSGRRQEIVSALYPWLEHNPDRAPAFARSFFTKEMNADDPALSHRTRWSTGASMLSILSPEIRNRLESFDASEHLIGSLPDEFGSWNELSRSQYLESKTLLSGYILSAQGDRQLMANSVEGRFPFLDHRLIEFAGMLPPRHKVMGLDEKYILKYAFSGDIPAEIIRRPKQPYRAPDAASFFAPAQQEWIDDLTTDAALNRSGVVDPVTVKRVIRKCRGKKGMGMSNADNMRITLILSLLLLDGQFIENNGEHSIGSAAWNRETVSIIDRTV